MATSLQRSACNPAGTKKDHFFRSCKLGNIKIKMRFVGIDLENNKIVLRFVGIAPKNNKFVLSR